MQVTGRIHLRSFYTDQDILMTPT